MFLFVKPLLFAIPTIDFLVYYRSTFIIVLTNNAME